MKLLSITSITLAIFAMAIEPATTAGALIHGAVVIALLCVGAYASNKSFTNPK